MTNFAYAEPSPFPPSFEGSPILYGFGLFGDVVAASLALTVLLSYCCEPWRHQRINRMLGNPIAHLEIPKWSVLFIYRTANISVLLFIVMRALPDALWMLLWGEVSESAIHSLLAFDLWLDGLALMPLGMAMLCWAWGRQAIPQKLIEQNQVLVRGGPPWEIALQNGRIILLVLMIAIGVTVGKYAAWKYAV